LLKVIFSPVEVLLNFLLLTADKKRIIEEKEQLFTGWA
jgi:hypothetical protein